MQTLDFSRSFLYWRIDGSSEKKHSSLTHKPPFSVNTCRVAVECRCVVADIEKGVEIVYVLGASCKTERVGVESNIWTQPNADFMPLCSESKFMSIKTFASVQTQVELYPESRGVQPENQIVDVDQAFDEFEIAPHLVDCRVLSEVDEVLDGTLDGQRLVVQTVIEEGPYRATIEYPVKTMNVSGRDRFFQTDTGPMLLPEFSGDASKMLENFQVAFSAVSGASGGEFLVREKVELRPSLFVYHYEKSRRLDGARNTILMLNE